MSNSSEHKAHANAPLVVGLGECLWDCFDDSRRPGGAPANFAFQANQLGLRGKMCSRVGDDDLGAEYLQFLADQQLDTAGIQRDAMHPTGRASITETTPGHPEFVIHAPAAWDFLEWTDDLAATARACAAVGFGTLAQRERVSRETIQRFVQETSASCLRMFDVNLRQQYYTAEILATSLERANAVKLNDHEADVLAELLDLGSAPDNDTDRLGKFAAALAPRYKLRLVCITRAARGCVLWEDGQTVAAAGEKVDVVDSVGAGDGFTAALVMTTLAGYELRQRANFANAVGGLIAGRSGAMPDLREEFASLRRDLLGKNR